VQAKRFALIVIVAVGFIATAPIQAETFTFDRHQVVLEPPKGYCTLDPGRPSEQATIENQKALQSTYNEVAMVYADCTDLEKLRAGQLPRLDNMGAFQIVKQAGSVSAFNGFNRPTYLDEVAKSLPHLDSKEIFDELNERSKSRGSGAMTLNTSGMLEQDQSAVYYGGVATVTLPDGSNVPKVFINATTLIDALGVAMSIARPSTGEADLKNLLAEQRENAAALIKANTALDVTAINPQGGRGFDMSQVLQSAIIGGLLGGVGGLIMMLVKRASKKRSAGQPGN